MAKNTFSFDDLGGRPGKVQSPAEKKRQQQMSSSVQKSVPKPVAPKATPPAAKKSLYDNVTGLGSRKKLLNDVMK